MMKFIASDVEAAKSKARRALGDNVVIVNVRNLPSGDVEVSASDRPEPAAPQRTGTPQFGDAARRLLDEREMGAAAPRSTGARLNEPIEKKFAEDALSRLRGDLSGGRRPPPVTSEGFQLGDRLASQLRDLLKPHGLDETLIDALIDGARRSPVDEDLYQLQTGFAETFGFAPLDLRSSTPIMLVGPTGAGKTSSCAKLAAAAMRDVGAAFIMTADVGRAGAIDQIKTYGDYLGADYYIVETPTEVESVMRTDRPRGFAILDTPGVSPYDSADLAVLRSFAESSGAEPILVLPASGDPNEYRDWGEAFGAFGVRRMILTKFDAARRVGAGVTAAFCGDIALAHFSETAFISEGLLPATPEYLARRLIANRAGRIA